MKLLNKLLALMLAFACIFALTACKGDEEEKIDKTKHGCALEYTEKTEKIDDEDVTYCVIKGLFVSDGDKYDIEKDNYESYNLVVGKDGKITVPTYDENDKPVYKDNKLVTEEKSFEHFKIAESAFANQTIIHSVEIYNTVEEIGAGAFAGCSNIKTMSLPFVGTKVGATNAGKLFASIFGTNECSGCVSVAGNYNTTETATYFLPSSLKEVVVNFSKPVVAEGEEAKDAVLPNYAFNKVTTLEKVTINGEIKAVSNNAFEGCTALKEVVLPAGVTSIGKSAFKGCTAMMNFAFPASLDTIFQEAFSGCSYLGYGRNKEFVLPASVTAVYTKAFAYCTSLKNVNLADLANIPESAFYGCAKLEKVTLKDQAVVGNNAFGKCPELKKENVVNFIDGTSDANGGFDFAE